MRNAVAEYGMIVGLDRLENWLVASKVSVPLPRIGSKYVKGTPKNEEHVTAPPPLVITLTGWKSNRFVRCR